jgi:WD40 repeat protein
VEALAFNHDGTMLATTNSEGVITLWDIASRRVIGNLTIDRTLGSASHLAFDTLDKQLAANTAAAVIVWDVDAKAWEQQACRRANRESFTDAEWNKYFGNEAQHRVC